MGGTHQPVALLAAVAAVLTLVACVSPVPSLGYGDTRGNLTATTALPVEGRTTREEVLLRLGSPDAMAPDGRRFGYASRRHEGGVGVWGIGQLAGGIPLGGFVEFTERRLVVDFDAQGVVSRARFDETRCPKAVGPFARAGACLPFDGLGLTPVGESMWPAGPEPAIATFDDAITTRHVQKTAEWTASEDLYGWTDDRRKLLESERVRGPVVVSESGITATTRSPSGSVAESVRIAFADIDDFVCRQLGATTSGTTTLLLTTHRGLAVSIMVMSTGALGGPDNPATERLIGIVEAKLGRPARPL